MKIVVSGVPNRQWDEWIRMLDGNIYHSVSWAETQSSVNRHPIFFHWLNASNRISAIGVGIESVSSFPILGKFSKHMEFGCYPICNPDSEDLIQELIPQVFAYVKQQGYSSLEIQSYYARKSDADFHADGFEKTNRLEFVIDLTLTNDQLLKNLSTNHRRKIKKAQNEDLRHEIGRDLKSMRILRDLQVQSRDRRIMRGEDIDTAEDIYFEQLGQAYFERNLGEVHYLTHNGNAVSASFISLYNGKGYYVFGGSNDTGFAMNAPGLLFMNIFSHCRQLGCREFNMGGVPALAVEKSAQSHGLYRFKAGFGGSQIPCTSLKADNLQPGKAWLFRLARMLLPGR